GGEIMLIRDFLKLAYTTKKGVFMNRHAITFMVKNNLKEDMDVSERELIILSQSLSSKEKRVDLINALLDCMSCCVQGVATWRKRTYKQVAKELHPDSDTGNKDDFQFLQEIKEFLWDCNGSPRKDIKKISWEIEKHVKNKADDYCPFAYGM
ncbi:MAG: hypothetical protein ACRCZL_06575, partial [Cetobacterium sp.]